VNISHVNLAESNVQKFWEDYKKSPETYKESIFFKLLEKQGKEIKELSFRTIFITDDFLEIILSLCPDIETLDLTLLQMKSSLPPLKQSYNPSFINISQLTNKGIACLSKLTNLKTLKIEGSTYLTAACLEHLSGLTTLKSLTLIDLNRLQDKGLASLSKLINLESLDLSGCWSLSDAGLAAIAGFTKLQTLNLHGCNMLRDACFVHFDSLINLQSLDLSMCNPMCNRMWGPESKHLIGLPLKHLNLRSSDILDADLQFVARLTSLESLDLSDNNHLSNEGLSYLLKLHNLKSLDLGWCSKITDEGLVYISKLINLKSLDLEDCTEITDDGLIYISKLINLETLDLGSSDLITDEGIKQLEVLTSLKSLNLDCAHECISDEGFAWAEQFCAKNRQKLEGSS
jgi:F-box and leucine-rich repeat protein 14